MTLRHYSLDIEVIIIAWTLRHYSLDKEAM